jgi:transposase
MDGQRRHDNDHLSARTRMDIVHMVRCDKKSQSAAGRRYGCTQQAVSLILKHYDSTGDTAERHGGGRPHEYSEEDMQLLSTLIYEHPSATAHTLSQLMPADAPPVSDRTLSRYRRELGFTRRTPPIHVIDTAGQLVARIVWTRQHRLDDPNDYVFMDESTMVLRDTGDYVWVRRGETTPAHDITNLRAAVHVWGAIWVEGAVFSQYTGHLNSHAYEHILDGNIGRYKRRFKDRTIIHDRATFHRTKTVKAWFTDHGLTAELLPAHSPQFNAIEYAWAWVKHQVREAQPDTPQALCASMTQACNLLPDTVRVAFINHAWNNICDAAR